VFGAPAVSPFVIGIVADVDDDGVDVDAAAVDAALVGVAGATAGGISGFFSLIARP